MLNYLWAIMIIAGIIWGIAKGDISTVTDGILTSAKDAVALCITMLGIMSFWSGIMKVGEKAGFIDWLSVKLNPVIRFLFPKLSAGHPARNHITTNIIANILGLGWAATPAGLKAMEKLAEYETTYEDTQESAEHVKNIKINRASDEMCTFLVLNISSLQLIPVNMIVYRSQYGSANPTLIVGPAIIATAISTIVAVVYCKLMCRRKRS